MFSCGLLFGHHMQVSFTYLSMIVYKVTKMIIYLAGVVMMAVFGDRNKITPLMAQCPSMAAKAATCFNPIVFALSHPK